MPCDYKLDRSLKRQREPKSETDLCNENITVQTPIHVFGVPFSANLKIKTTRLFNGQQPVHTLLVETQASKYVVCSHCRVTCEKSNAKPNWQQIKLCPHQRLSFSSPYKKIILSSELVFPSSYQAVLLAVVEPVPGPAGSDDALQLVRLDPDELVDAVVPPQLQTLPTQLHRSACANKTPGVKQQVFYCFDFA